MAASNTRECFSDQVGKRVIGVLFDALPLGDASLSAGAKTLVFDDGTGLTIAANGTFGEESAPDVAKAIANKQAELEQTQTELTQVLSLAKAATAISAPTPMPVTVG